MDFCLKKLQLLNFRNLNSEILDFSSGLNCIFGENGNGKTNLLEAIQFLINRKSFRKNTSFPQMISTDSEKAEIIFSAVFFINDEIETYSGKININESSWYKNNIPTKKKPGIETYFINPFDSYAFHNTASFRRDWFDSNFSKISKGYKKNLKDYDQALRFRNKLLSKKPPKYKEQINAIDPQIANYSYDLIQERIKLVENLNEYSTKTFKKIFDENHELKIVYKSKFEKFSKEEIASFLSQNIHKDDVMCKTQYGIHRDDYVFNFDGFVSYEYCSLGQQKMSFLSLIFAYIELFRYKFSSYPIVLIDDVSGELDSRRWENLISYLEAKKFQVMITTANENFREKLEKITGSKKFFIANGDLKQI
jgi:DNA replication and repair protein RecF